jgi:hypothetical protein
MTLVLPRRARLGARDRAVVSAGVKISSVRWPSTVRSSTRTRWTALVSSACCAPTSRNPSKQTPSLSSSLEEGDQLRRLERRYPGQPCLDQLRMVGSSGNIALLFIVPGTSSSRSMKLLSRSTMRGGRRTEHQDRLDRAAHRRCIGRVTLHLPEDREREKRGAHGDRHRPLASDDPTAHDDADEDRNARRTSKRWITPPSESSARSRGATSRRR